MTPQDGFIKPEDLQKIIAQAKRTTTVFADGSTYDPKDGYSSSGNAYSTAKIVKHYQLDWEKILNAVVGVLLTAVILVVAFFGVRAFTVEVQENSNHAVIVEKMKANGVNVVDGKVISGEGGDYLLIEMGGQFLKCDVTVVKHEIPVGLIFCQTGAPAVMSVPVPHDPTNIFYKATNEEK